MRIERLSDSNVFGKHTQCVHTWDFEISVWMNLKHHHRVYKIKYLHTWFRCGHSHHALGTWKLMYNNMGLCRTSNTNLAVIIVLRVIQFVWLLTKMLLVVSLTRCNFKKKKTKKKTLREVKFDTQIEKLLELLSIDDDK